MLYVLGIITETPTHEVYEFLMPNGEFQAGIQGAATYDEKTAKKLARQYRCKIVSIHPDYADELELKI